MVPGDDADEGEDGNSRVTEVMTDSEEGDPDTGVQVNVVAAGGESACLHVESEPMEVLLLLPPPLLLELPLLQFERLELVTAVSDKEVTAGEDTVVRLVTERGEQLVTTEADEEEEEEEQAEVEVQVEEEGDEEVILPLLLLLLLLLVTSFNKRLDLLGGGVERGGLVLLRFKFEEVLLWLGW